MYQVYVGAVPKFVPDAVKKTFPPEQTDIWLETMLAVGVMPLVTVKLTTLDVAVVLVKQLGKVPPAATFAEIKSPLAGE